MRMLARALVVALAAVLLIPAVASAAWPVASRSSHVSQFYTRRHHAIDIAVTSGTRVVPIGNGRVVFAGWKNNCGGYQVWIRHPSGLYSAYFHLRREVAYRGEWVTGSRTTIGYVGMTGCATGPHTHVELWHGYPWGRYSYRMNPWRYIDKGVYLPYRYR
jgi:murein DD-endopeptidase MepM/ murein hydrolase activator NlpD